MTPGWDEDDRALLRALGGRISQIIHGEDLDVPDLQRRDELGILANMLSRLARELGAARRRDREHRAELERRVEELQMAYDTQEVLLTTLRRLRSPLLEPHPGVLLVPLVGALNAARASHEMPALLERLVGDRPRVLIVHLTGEESVTPEAALLVLHAERVARPLGARVILSGVTLAVARARGVDVSHVLRCDDLQEALSRALDLVEPDRAM